MAFCANCGANVTDGSRFCHNCGQKVPVAPAPGTQNEYRQEPENQTPPPEGQWQGYHYGTGQDHQQGNGNQQSDSYGQQQNYGYGQGYGQGGHQGYGQGYGYSAPPPPVYNSYEQDVADNKGISILCYFGILLLIPLLTRPGSQYVRHHANQGLVLLLFGIALGVVAVVPILGWIVSVVGYIFAFVCWIIGLVGVCGGKMSILPLIGRIVVLR